MNNDTWQQLLNVDSQDIANLIPIKNIQHAQNCCLCFIFNHCQDDLVSDFFPNCLYET